MTPCRIIDTRGPVGPFGGPALAIGVDRAVQIAGRCGIPLTAKAVAANVTVVTPGGNGYLRLAPSAVFPRPNTMSVSFRTGRTRASSTIIGLNANGYLDVYNGGTAAVHFIVDVSAYFQ